MEKDTSYKWDAEDYEKNSHTQQLWARELIKKLDVSANENILDIGCGDGKVTAEIAGLLSGGNVMGIDSSPAMIELARQRFVGKELPSLEFELMDASVLSYKNRFDLVFSNAALHWVTDHKPVLEGIFKSLKKNGRMLIQMGGRGNAKEVIQAFDELKKDKQWAEYFEDFSFPYGFFGDEEYTEWLKKTGFIVKRAELIPKNMVHKGKKGFAGWVRTTWLPYIERVPEEKRDLFIEELVLLYLRKVPLDLNGDVNISMVRLEVEAVKP